MTYSSRPERKGYTLTEEGENLYSDWLDRGGCFCHTGCAPCSTCTFEGHPISLEETDEVWEPELVFPEMSPFKSIYEEWSGKNKDKSFAQQISETEGGGMARYKIVNKSGVKDPPEFKVGNWYKCIDPSNEVLRIGKYYKFVNKSAWNTGRFEDENGRGVGGWNYTRFDVNSEASFNPMIEQPRGTPDHLLDSLSTCVGIVRQTNDLTKQTEEKQTMSNANNRRVLTVQVFDLDPALDVELSLVHVFKDVVTEDTNEVTLTELLHTGQLVEPLALHNKKRVAQDNKDILSRTGKKVKLEPVKVKNLSFKYV